MILLLFAVAFFVEEWGCLSERALLDRLVVYYLVFLLPSGAIAATLSNDPATIGAIMVLVMAAGAIRKEVQLTKQRNRR